MISAELGVHLLAAFLIGSELGSVLPTQTKLTQLDFDSSGQSEGDSHSVIERFFISLFNVNSVYCRMCCDDRLKTKFVEVKPISSSSQTRMHVTVSVH